MPAYGVKRTGRKTAPRPIRLNVLRRGSRYQRTLDPSKILHEPWIDRLVSEPDADKRLSLSLEAVMQLTGSPGASQWLELSPGHFQCMRERGLTDESVSQEVLGEVAAGRWDPRLPQSMVLVAREAPNRMAWALSTPIPHEHAMDSAEAFLFLVGVLHPPAYEAEFPSLLPHRDEDESS